MRAVPLYPAASLLLSSLLASTAALAAEWTREAGVSVGSFYSDNICLAPNIEEGKAGATFTPRVSITGEGSRASTSLQASAEYNSVGDSSLVCPERGVGFNPANREVWVPRLNFLSSFEAVENWLFLEADAYAAQNPFNPFAAGGADNLNATGNTNITYQWGVGARIERQFSREWAALLRYNYNEQYNSINQVLGDSQEDRVDFDLGKIPGVSLFTYGISGQYSEVTFEENALQPAFTNRLSRAEVRAAVQITSDWQVNGLAGEEDNIFLADSDEIDGSYWDVGVSWSPNSRVSVDVGYGERFFGDAPRFAVSYRHKRSELRATYNRDLRFPRNIRASDSGIDPQDPFAPGLGDPGNPLVSGGDPTFIGQSPLLDERFTLSYIFTARRTTFSVSASDSTQTRAIDSRRGDFRTVSVSLQRQLARQLSVSLNGSWTNNEGDPAIGAGEPLFFQNLEAVRATLGLTRPLSSRSSLTVRYTYTDQTSGQALNTFVENRAEVSLSHSF